MDPISLLIVLLIFAVIVWLCFWIIGLAFPAPIQQIARVVVGILALLFLLGMLTGRLGPFPVIVRR